MLFTEIDCFNAPGTRLLCHIELNIILFSSNTGKKMHALAKEQKITNIYGLIFANLPHIINWPERKFSQSLVLLQASHS